jgi:hypothetical protein
MKPSSYCDYQTPIFREVSLAHRRENETAVACVTSEIIRGQATRRAAVVRHDNQGYSVSGYETPK